MLKDQKTYSVKISDTEFLEFQVYDEETREKFPNFRFDENSEVSLQIDERDEYDNGFYTNMSKKDFREFVKNLNKLVDEIF